MNTATRYCPACAQQRLVGQFYFRKGKPSGYCKDCTKSKALDWLHKKREEVIGPDRARELREKHRHFDTMAKRDSRHTGERTCRHCEKVLLVSAFYTNAGKPDSYCKCCRILVDKQLNSKSSASRMRSLLTAARTRARNSHWDFNLTKDFLLGLWGKQEGRCYYSEVALTFDGNRAVTALSIDRIDSTRGYTTDNVVLCCRLVNEMKSNQTIEDFVERCRRIVKIHEKRSRTWQDSQLGNLISATCRAG